MMFSNKSRIDKLESKIDSLHYDLGQLAMRIVGMEDHMNSLSKKFKDFKSSCNIYDHDIKAYREFKIGELVYVRRHPNTNTHLGRVHNIIYDMFNSVTIEIEIGLYKDGSKELISFEGYNNIVDRVKHIK